MPRSAPDRRGQLRVTDTGVGMDAEALARIFGPYFSTKAIGWVWASTTPAPCRGERRDDQRILEAWPRHERQALLAAEPGTGVSQDIAPEPPHAAVLGARRRHHRAQGRLRAQHGRHRPGLARERRCRASDSSNSGHHRGARATPALRLMMNRWIAEVAIRLPTPCGQGRGALRCRPRGVERDPERAARPDAAVASAPRHDAGGRSGRGNGPHLQHRALRLSHGSNPPDQQDGTGAAEGTF